MVQLVLQPAVAPAFVPLAASSAKTVLPTVMTARNVQICCAFAVPIAFIIPLLVRRIRGRLVRSYASGLRVERRLFPCLPGKTQSPESWIFLLNFGYPLRAKTFFAQYHTSQGARKSAIHQFLKYQFEDFMRIICRVWRARTSETITHSLRLSSLPVATQSWREDPSLQHDQ